jgi:hypothetical protein
VNSELSMVVVSVYSNGSIYYWVRGNKVNPPSPAPSTIHLKFAVQQLSHEVLQIKMQKGGSGSGLTFPKGGNRGNRSAL